MDLCNFVNDLTKVWNGLKTTICKSNQGKCHLVDCGYNYE